MSGTSFTARPVAVGLAFLLAACGNGGIEGSYRDELGASEYRFGGDGTVSIRTLGMRFDAEYEVKDDQIIIHGPHGTLVFRRQGQELMGPMGLALHPISETDKGADQ